MDIPLLQPKTKPPPKPTPFCPTLILGILVTTAFVIFQTKVPSPPTKPPIVGILPLLPSYCVSWDTNFQPYYVPITINGRTYAVIPDTGSSNLAIASESCISCDVHPKVPSNLLPKSIQNMTTHQRQHSPLAFQIDYGTGSTLSVDSKVQFTIPNGNLQFQGQASLIILQNTSFGFNLFPPKPSHHPLPEIATPVQDTCYDTYAGVLGLAYQGQGASAKTNTTQGPSITNGTRTQLIDIMVDELGMTNAFALEICNTYPYSCTPQRRINHNTWTPSSAQTCRKERVGHLMLGGYISSRISEMYYAKLTDEIHYDVRLLGMTVCGKNGCANVVFPDKLDGETEADCLCKGNTLCNKNTITDPNKFEYCYFSVVESGAGRIYMNTYKNAYALLTTMRDVGMIDGVQVQDEEGFWFDKVSQSNANIHTNASFHVHLEGTNDGNTISVPVDLHGIFRSTNSSLIQWGIQGDMNVLKNYTANKFPTLLGEPFFMGKTIFFDRSRKRVGFGISKEGVCDQVAVAEDIDVFGANSLPTPGSGCKIGSGSGGGCV